MGSPVSPSVANLYMEHFESIALSTAPRPPSLWFRYVDDTFVLTHEDDVDSLTSHINNIDDHIQTYVLLSWMMPPPRSPSTGSPRTPTNT